jgi:uncharacterized membrane protein YeaQ/YmgE (transglycosylase-associated protein family)
MDAQRLLVMGAIGLVAGWLGSIVVGGVRGGLVGCLVAGLLGSIVGGWILTQSGVKIGVGNALADNIITSTIGAIVVILIARLLL